MKVILFGASGMVGQGVLRECLLAPDVERVLAVVRAPLPQQHPKLQVVQHGDFQDFSSIADLLTGYDACFFCLGVSSAGLGKAEYRRVTLGTTQAAGRVIAERNPGLTFVFVSGAGTDASSKTMWARVKGEAENAVFALPVKTAFAFRPAFIRPLHGIRSRTRLYNALYAVLRPLAPLVERVWPDQASTTEKVGRAMLNAVRKGAPKRVLETKDINALAEA